MAPSVPAYASYNATAAKDALDFIHIDRVMTDRSAHQGSVPVHLHPHFAQLSLWFKGGGRYTIEDRSWEFTAPMMHYVPANTLHGFEVDPQSSDCWTITIAQQGLADLQGCPPFDLTRSHYVCGGEGDPRDWAEAEALFPLIEAEYRSERPGRLRMIGLYTSAMFELFARLTGAGCSLPPNASTGLALRFQSLIDQHHADNWQIDDYCRLLGVSRHQLHRACQAAWNTGIKEAIDQTRLRVAQRILHYTVRSVEAVAFESGFNDPTYFSRFFRKMTGLSPAAWRRQSRGPE